MRAVEGWKPKKLSDLADYINGFAFKPDDWGEEGLPIIRIEQLRNPDAPTDHYAGRLPVAQIIDNGDLIFSWSASLFLRIWRHGQAALNQHLFKVVEKDGVDRTFLKAFIEFYLPELTKASHGSTMQHLTRKELVRFGALFPIDKHEQAKIAEIISTVDRAIEQTEELIAKQQRIETGLMQALLTRGIDEHGNLRSEQTHQFKDSPLGRIPVEWEISSVNSVLAQPPKNGYSPVESGDWDGTYMLGLGCLTSEGFQPNQLKYAPKADQAFEAALLKNGDFLISRSNTRALVGMVGIYKDMGEPCIYPDLMVRLRFNSKVSIDYMELLFSSPALRRQVQNAATGTSGSMVKISSTIIKGLCFRKPPIDEQVNIVSKFQTMVTCILKNKDYLAKLRSLKTSIMQDLLTGKKRVTALQNDPESMSSCEPGQNPSLYQLE